MERFITEEDLLSGMQLIVIETRYTAGKYAAVFGSTQTQFSEMVDSLTDGGSDWENAYRFFTLTSWYPYGEGDTISKAVEAAITRINTIDPKYKREALALVHNSASDWSKDYSKPMVPLVLTGEDWG